MFAYEQKKIKQLGETIHPAAARFRNSDPIMSLL